MKEKSFKGNLNYNKRMSLRREASFIKPKLKSDHGDGGTGGVEIPIKFKVERT